MNASVLAATQSMVVYWYEIGLYCKWTSWTGVLPASNHYIHIFVRANLSAIWSRHHPARKNKQGWTVWPWAQTFIMAHSYAGIWLCGCLFLLSCPCILLCFYSPHNWSHSNLMSVNYLTTAEAPRRSFFLLKSCQNVGLWAFQSHLFPYFFYQFVLKNSFILFYCIIYIYMFL